MSIEQFQEKIDELEKKISQNIGDIQEMKKKINTLRIQQFEEDLREQGNKQLLQE
jgi:predicted  nucleic acid-binding Zn-ribbon protein